MTVHTNQLTKALIELGLGNEDSVLIHSDSTLAMQLSGAEWWEEAFEFQIDALQAAVGPNGTLLVPTFNYDFCEGVPYDHAESRSQVGMFTNFVLDLPQSTRSFHPIFSFAGFGSGAESLLETSSNSSFGPGSVFENMYDADTLILFLMYHLSSAHLSILLSNELAWITGTSSNSLAS